MNPRRVMLLALIPLAACTATQRLPETLDVGYPSADVIDLPVCLVLDDALRAAEWSSRSAASLGMRERIPFGEALAEQAKRMAHATFRSVEVVDSAAAAAPGSCALLAPRFAGASRTRPGRQFEELHLVVLLEWWLKDPGGHPVWVETIRGTGIAPVEGLVFNRGAATNRIGDALEQLFLESHRALTTSPEVRAYAERWELEASGRRLLFRDIRRGFRADGQESTRRLEPAHHP